MAAEMPIEKYICENYRDGIRNACQKSMLEFSNPAFQGEVRWIANYVPRLKNVIKSKAPQSKTVLSFSAYIFDTPTQNLQNAGAGTFRETFQRPSFACFDLRDQ